MKWLPRVFDWFSLRAPAALPASAQVVANVPPVPVSGKLSLAALPLFALPLAAAVLLLAGQASLSASVLGENPKITIIDPRPVAAAGTMGQRLPDEVLAKIGPVLRREFEGIGNLNEDFYVGTFTAKESAAGTGDYAIESLRMTAVIPGKNDLQVIDETGAFKVDIELSSRGEDWLLAGKVAHVLRTQPQQGYSMHMEVTLPEGLFAIVTRSLSEVVRVIDKDVDEQRRGRVGGFFSLRPPQEPR